LTLTNRRNNQGSNGVPSIYRAALNRRGAYTLASHEIDRTFTHSVDNDEKQGKTFIMYVKIGNKKTFIAHMVSEVGFESDVQTVILSLRRHVSKARANLQDELTSSMYSV
jgi:hypothetical protein